MALFKGGDTPHVGGRRAIRNEQSEDCLINDDNCTY